MYLQCVCTSKRSPAGRRFPIHGYVVIHLVVQEALKDLIGPQVIDPMYEQLITPGSLRPMDAVVGLLEPFRRAFRRALRARVRALRARAPGVRVVVLPYVSRFDMGRNACFVAACLRRYTKGRPVVFHCRGEAAVHWARALRPAFQGSGIVADIRGAWPEELLHARGLDGPEGAGPELLEAYRVTVERLQEALRVAGGILGVSETLLDWLVTQGAPRDSMRCVPCCVRGLHFDPQIRTEVRRALGISDRVVFAYLGTTGRYQHIEDGVATFIRLAGEVCPQAYLLCLTPEPDRMWAMLRAAGIEEHRVGLRTVPQEEVARYLCAADAGLLLRAPSRVNRVSMPVKLGEYLASGVPVITSRIEGWVDQLIEDNRAGLVLDWFDRPEAHQRAEVAQACKLIVRRGTFLRGRALALCASHFVWSRYVPEVRRVYQAALRGNGGNPLLERTIA